MTRLMVPTRIERHPGTVDLLACAARLGELPQVLTVRGWTVAVGGPLRLVRDLDELSRVADHLGWRDDPPADGPPFTGGLAGLLTDDLSRGLLDLPPADPRPAIAPLSSLLFGVYDRAVCQDPGGQVWLVAANLPGYSRTPTDERLAELREVARASGPGAGGPGAGGPGAAGPGGDRDPAASHADATSAAPSLARPSLDRAAHAAAVAQVLEWIAAGDLYQLNLTVQLQAPWPAGGQALARRLWAATPDAAHAAWLSLPSGVEIVSASPETFLRCDGATAVVRPIKGTRPRAADPARDEAQRDELLASAKDRAEHVMIVDLERNDLGRVAVPGTVRVRELAALEAHPTVWHLTSTVAAELRPNVDLGALLRATFPCGSVTGAPKRMAVERIARVEPVRRGVYCGAIGVVSQGLVDLSVAIRTAVVHDGSACYGTGGGIVADSDPDAEWQEVVHKAAAFFVAANTRLA